MTTLLIWFVVIACLPAFLPVIVLIVEIAAALLPVRRSAAPSMIRPNCVVLIPAHNEENGIVRTLSSIFPQLTAGDRILVVADNCSDATASLARAAGAEAVERTDATRRGKGYALDFGVRKLANDPPAVVAILDADCVLETGSLDRLVRTAAARGRPVQAAYEMEVPPGGDARSQLAAFLFSLKNCVRPRGLARLGMPCLLTGTGMAFPWDLIRNAPLASGNIVEDMQLGIDLAIAGKPPVFCQDARVISELPVSRGAVTSQRKRWIHGHLATLTSQAPRLVVRAIRQRKLSLLGMAAELSVPPLSLLIALVVMATTLLTASWYVGGPTLPPLFAVATSALAIAVLALAWIRFGRQYVSLSTLFITPLELLSRLATLFLYVLRPQKAWIRTERRNSL
jgi:cellulose synthase/poly-beta-1,6-N-acetylglucosamine synthase-like glycosyltransferase